MNEELAKTFEMYSLDDSEARDYINGLFADYKQKKESGQFYYSFDYVMHNIIGLYYYFVTKKKFEVIFQDFKDKYIYNESRVEDNSTVEEQLGIGEVYDYIKSYNFETNDFNIFLESMRIHQLLYSKCVGKSFGGALRTDTAILYDTDIEVTPALEAQKYFNDYILKSEPLMKELEHQNIFDYIANCIIITTDLIRVQPFPDGNKRTFRALLNLMLKNKSIPPIYVKVEEKDEYKELLLEGMKGKYDRLIRFYMYKICDYIVELDFTYKPEAPHM